MKQPYSVLWWTPRGLIPSIEEAGKRLEQLQQTGPTPQAFTFKKAFEAPDGDIGEEQQPPLSLDDSCLAGSA